jgi:ATP-dependent Clp protease ATP-binding subunit ClpC
MFRDFCKQANRAMQRAGVEARALNHQYIGTEHILLGLVADETESAANMLRVLGVSADAIRQEVESLVQRGMEQVSPGPLRLTPRSQQVIEFAREEAGAVNQVSVDAEHLLLALLREPDGVAGQVLRNLGVKPDELRAEALKTRLSLMKIVERAVRPVRASIVSKRKMREELFAHITGIYEQELARVHDPAAALERASSRFGSPAELARELESTLPAYERISVFIERLLQYRAPESAVRYSLRQAFHTFWILATILSLVTLGLFAGYGWIEAVQTMARVFGAILLLTPPLQFAVGLATIKMRDAMWGAFGSRKSHARVFAFWVLIAVVSELYLMGVAAVASWDLRAGLDAAGVGGAIGVIAALAFLSIAYINGRETIRDTQWALLDIAS